MLTRLRAIRWKQRFASDGKLHAEGVNNNSCKKYYLLVGRRGRNGAEGTHSGKSVSVFTAAHRRLRFGAISLSSSICHGARGKLMASRPLIGRLIELSAF